MTPDLAAGEKHRIAESWRDVVIRCSCGWIGFEKTMKAVRLSWKQHKAQPHG